MTTDLWQSLGIAVLAITAFVQSLTIAAIRRRLRGE